MSGASLLGRSTPSFSSVLWIEQEGPSARSRRQSAHMARRCSRQSRYRHSDGLSNLFTRKGDRKMKVTDFMTDEPSCCTADANLRDVAQMMVDFDCGCIPVVDDHK